MDLEYMNLGIPSDGREYLYLNELQIENKEYLKIQKFLNVFLSQKDKYSFLNAKEKEIAFINYGDLELVYVLKCDNQYYTLLVKQPNVEMGTLKKEYENLKKLSSYAPDVVVSPIAYYKDNDKELYVTPYYMQARCVASQWSGWGIYVPEPYYHFELFNKEQKKQVNTCMIANLIRLYDEEEELAIGRCKLGGGDFILEKSWSDKLLSTSATLKRIKLIAARELLIMSLNDYISLIKDEFSRVTFLESAEGILNLRGRVAMTNDEIKNGIQLGLELRKRNS